jgi:hypothetical protein
MKTNTFMNTVAAVVLMGALMMPVLAQGHRDDPSIRARLRDQNARIDQGVRSGQLTRMEAARLRDRDVNIRFDNRIAHISGGKFTRAERARLEAKLNRTSGAIYHDKHNDHMR